MTLWKTMNLLVEIVYMIMDVEITKNAGRGCCGSARVVPGKDDA